MIFFTQVGIDKYYYLIKSINLLSINLTRFYYFKLINFVYVNNYIYNLPIINYFILDQRA